jgi:hypothetical protein
MKRVVGGRHQRPQQRHALVETRRVVGFIPCIRGRIGNVGIVYDADAEVSEHDAEKGLTIGGRITLLLRPSA